MIKGAQKRMVIVKTNDSKLFEEAHFVMREKSRAEKSDILAEANRIILACGVCGKSEKKKDMRRLLFVLFFSSGVLFGGGMMLLLTSLF